MTNSSEKQTPDGVIERVRGHEDRAAALGLAVSPIMLAQAQELHAGYRAALSCPERFAVGRRLSKGEVRDLVERSIRADFAFALGVSEWTMARTLERAVLLVEELPATCAALREKKLLWDAAVAICSAAGDLPRESLAAFDERAVSVAGGKTPSQLRRELSRLREELHPAPLSERHAEAAERRAVWLTAERDGMCTLSALLPAHVALGAYNRLDRIARSLREREGEGEQRTLAQLRADAAGELLCDGDIAGTTPVDDENTPASAFVPGVRAEVAITVPVFTAAGLSEAPAEFDGYGPIPAEIARELVGTASAFYRVLTDPVTAMVLSVGRAQYPPPGSMRRLLRFRDRTCRFAACVRRAARSELDHAVEWSKGGETATHNLMHLCTGHHHVRHGERWTYRLSPDGTAEWTTPTGRRVTTRPSPVPGAHTGPLPRRPEATGPRDGPSPAAPRPSPSFSDPPWAEFPPDPDGSAKPPAF